MSEDWEARADRAEALLREVMELCDDVFANPAAHVPPAPHHRCTPTAPV